MKLVGGFWDHLSQGYQRETLLTLLKFFKELLSQIRIFSVELKKEYKANKSVINHTTCNHLYTWDLKLRSITMIAFK